MKRTLVAFLAVAAAPCFAAASNTFVGKFGEVLEFPETHVADAQMRHSMEIVLIHPRDARPDMDHLKPEDFRKLNLMELIVVPKSPVPDTKGALDRVGDLRKYDRVEELCARKSLELFDQRQSLGLKYYFTENCPGSPGCATTTGYEWAPGTCLVNISKPYHLFQAYAQSKGEIYILTGGINMDESEDYYRFTDPTVASLMRFLRPVAVPQVDPWKPLKKYARERRVWILLLALNGAFLILAGLPIARWRSRLKLLGLSMAGFANGLYAVGISSAILEVVGLGPKSPHEGLVGIAAICATPLACWLIARKLRAVNKALAVGSIAVAAAGLAYFFSTGMEAEAPPDFSLFISELLFCCGIIIGLLFGVIIRRKENPADEE